MKVRSHTLSLSAARGIAVLCAAVFVATARPAHAGVNVWTSHGPGFEPVAALAIDPTMPSTLYAGTDGSGRGVYKSTDGASSWQAVNAGLTNTVSALAIDPTTPSTLYAGTMMRGGVFTIEQISACVGDCGGTATVAISDLITLVSIALGNEPSACPNGLPVDSDVDIAVLIEAVDNALHGCGAPQTAYDAREETRS